MCLRRFGTLDILRNLSLILSQFICNKTCVQKLKRKLKKEIYIADKCILN